MTEIPGTELSGTESPGTLPTPPAGRREMPEWLRAFGFRRQSIVYVELVAIVVFLIWVPATFAATSTVTGILDQNAVTGLVALALVVPLAAEAPPAAPASWEP